MFTKASKFKKAATWVVLLFSMTCFVGCAVEKGTVYKKDGKVYGKTDGLFKAEWDDYYLRGISYSEGGYFEDASVDFSLAIRKRDTDQRRARTYGMHFIDYFPNRELGIAYYNQKKFQKAIEALETSLESVETARAKFYLNKARKAWLDQTKLDKTAPVLSVQFPPPVYRTNDFSISIKGTARDDYFVSNVILNGKASELELSQKEISFQEVFPLQHGKNVITLQSEDILGKTSLPLTIQVKVDRAGPLVFLYTERTGNIISVKGALYDTSTISTILLNNRTLAFNEASFVEVKEEFALASLAKGPSIQFETIDSVGNRTRGDLKWIQNAYNDKSLSMVTYPLVASSKPLAAGVKKRISEITIKGLRDGMTMYHDTLTIQGSVRSGEGINDLIINRQSLLNAKEDPSITSFLRLLKEKKGRSLAFSKTIQLEEGENTVYAALTDVQGNVTEQELTVTRKIPTVRQLGSRLSVTIFPFTETKKTGEILRSYVHTFLNHSFVDQQRFKVLERDRLNKTLEQQQLNRKAHFDQETALRLGRLMTSDTVLIGNIAASGESIEINAQLLDAENAHIIAEKDVYWEGDVTAGFRGILDRLALKFKEHLPLCEGSVTEIFPRDVIIDLGAHRSIHRGMKFLAFRENAPLIDSVTGMNLGSDTAIIGLLSAQEVDQTCSKADVVEQFIEGGIRAGNKVIAK